MPEEKPKEQKEDPNYNNSWYAVTPNRLLVTLGTLRGEINCDVCVIGAGFTGISAAFELVQKGYSVTLIEAKNIIDSAPGKSGNHLLRGYHHAPATLAKKYGPAGAKMLSNLTLEGLALIVERIAKHDIKCDLKFGHVTTAITPDQASALKKRIDDWAKLGHVDLKYLSKKDIPAYVDTKKYIGGLFDPKGAHFHPMNYMLGVTQTAQNAGCKIYDETPVLSVTPGSPARVETKHGAVNAKFVVLGGYVRIPGIPRLNKKIIPAALPMLATQPLGDRISHKILPKNSAIIDSHRIMNYFKLSNDNRLIFGCVGQGINLQQRMTAIFPDLADARIAHQWNSPLDFTLNHMPNFGRLADNIFYAQGYCGQGIILGNLAGKLIAEAVSGTAERFDVFARVKHMSIPGGDELKKRILALGMAWYRLQDSLL
jgi:gamma-glutamylputrescine oxidase